MEYTIELTDAQAERLIATANALNAHGVQTLVFVEGDTQRGYCGNVLVHIADQIAAERERNRPLAVFDRVITPQGSCGPIIAMHGFIMWVKTGESVARAFHASDLRRLTERVS